MLQLVKNHQRIFLGLLSIDLIILVLHLLYAKNNHFFHLDFESNLPTFWQGFKLLFFGGIFFLAGFSGHIKKEVTYFILPLALFMSFLGLDELLQIHENIYRIFEFFTWLHPSKIVDASMKMGYRSSLWILYYLPLIFIFVFWSGYWLRYFQSKMKSNVWIIILSSLALFVVLLTEILSSTGSYSEQAYYWLVTLEEMAEMLLASTLILVGNKVIGKHTR